MKTHKKGSIFDAYREGCDVIRCCALSGFDDKGELLAIDLDSGKWHNLKEWECDEPIIKDIYSGDDLEDIL